MRILKPGFYNRDPLLVAREILGKVLVRRWHSQIISGRIVEVEAYLGSNDEAAHAFRGRRKSNLSLYSSAGHAYVHSMHGQNCLDIVTQEVDVPSSILVRALEPLAGIQLMRDFRHRTELRDLTSGPGKLTQALQITKVFDGIDMTRLTSELFVIDDGFEGNNLVITKRIGLSKAQDKEFRYYLRGNAFVSKK